MKALLGLIAVLLTILVLLSFCTPDPTKSSGTANGELLSTEGKNSEEMPGRAAAENGNAEKPIDSSSDSGSSLMFGTVANRDEAEIHALVQEYYDALRAKNYEQAVVLWEPGAFDAAARPNVAGVDLQPADLLRAWTELGGPIPDQVKLVDLRIEGAHAQGEIVIDRKGNGPVSIVGKDARTGKRLGTWAMTMHFTKQGDMWWISMHDAEGKELGVGTMVEELEIQH